MKNLSHVSEKGGELHCTPKIIQHEKLHFTDVDIFANKKEKTHKHINETKDTQTKEHTTKKMFKGCT